MSKLQKALDSLLKKARALDPNAWPEDEPRWDPTLLDEDERAELDHLYKRWLWEVAPELRHRLRAWTTRREMIEKSDVNRRIYTDGRPGWAPPPVAPIAEALTEEERLRLAFFLAQCWVGSPVVLDTLGPTGMLTLWASARRSAAGLSASWRRGRASLSVENHLTTARPVAYLDLICLVGPTHVRPGNHLSSSSRPERAKLDVSSPDCFGKGLHPLTRVDRIGYVRNEQHDRVGDEVALVRNGDLPNPVIQLVGSRVIG